MTSENFRIELGGDGVALVTWDMPGRSMNVFTMGALEDLEGIVETVSVDAAVKGVIVASGKKDFSGGADITMLAGLFDAFKAKLASDPEAAQQELFDHSSRMSR